MKRRPPSLEQIEKEVLEIIAKAQENRRKHKMDALKNLFSSSTPHGRVLRTVLQTFVGITALVGWIITIPEVQTWFASLPWVAQIGGAAVFVGIVAAIQNYAKELWDKVK